MGRSRKLPTQPFPVTIDSLLENGRGSAVVEGAALQVHDALPGERVMARYLLGRRLRGQAACEAVLEAAADRISPRCTHYGTCSACSLQHLQPGAQILFKQRVLEAHLREHGVAPGRWLAPLQADLWHYRRKARLSVRYVAAKERALVGFRERDGRFVADLEACPVLPEGFTRHLADLAAALGDLEARARIPQVEVTCGDHSVALVIRNLDPLSVADQERLRTFARTTGLAVLLQPGGPDSVEALEPDSAELAYGLPEFGLEFRFLPQDFVQVNAGINRAMVPQALDLLQAGADDHVLELFCGLGNFSLPLARRCRSVHALEGDAGLVARARANAALNGLENVRFETADLYTAGFEGVPERAPCDKILLDPPRPGAGERVLGIIAGSGAQRVVYVSCNPATLAADAAALGRAGDYRLEAAGVMDMFPHTGHVESMALFVKI